MAEGPPQQKRVCLTGDELNELSKDDIIKRWEEQDLYINSIVSAPSANQNDEQLRKQQQEAARRENVLVMRLTTKEQELQDCVSQLEESKRAQNPSTAHLREILLDPAINLMFQRMKKEMDFCKDKLEQAQNDLAAWKFTPDGQTGKRLMAKCRMLLQENDELGINISAGRTAKLEGEVALEKKFVEEMKTSQAETDEFLVEMDEDVEGMQSTIYVLQQQLKDTKEQILDLQTENAQLKNIQDSMERMDTSYGNNDTSHLNPSYQGEVKQTDSAVTDTRTDKLRTTDNGNHIGSHYQETGQESAKLVENRTANDEAQKMDTGDSTSVMQHQDNGYASGETKANHQTCHSSPKEGQTEAFEEKIRTATPTQDDSDQARTMSKNEGSGVTRDNELVQNGLIGAQYDSSQDEM